MNDAPRSGRRPVAMIVHSYYDEDPRVRREAEALVAAGRPVEVFGLRRPDDPVTSVVAGVQVHRLPVGRHQGAGISTYLREYLAFLVRASAAVMASHRRRRYAAVQVHSLPDFLVFAGLPLRVTGVPLVLDLHEAMPEFFRSRFPRVRNPLVHRAVGLQELVSIRAADIVITTNDAMRDRLLGLGVPDAKVHVVLNTPALSRFRPEAHPERSFMEDGTLRLIYTGALTPIYELDVVLEGLAMLRAERPAVPVTLDLYGRGDSRAHLEARSRELGLASSVRFHDRVPLEDVPALVAAADVGIAPTRRDRFTDLTISTKVFEYAVMGKPVVATRLRALERYVPDGALSLYASGDARGFVAAVVDLIDAPDARAARVERARARLADLSWEREAERYVALIDGLAGRTPRRALAATP
jgi:glycosyltransferase involved in cell wall biosynthesis